MTQTWTKEQTAAIAAVRAAARVCRAVRSRLVRPETLQKKDRSPVTVADYASQAVVCARLCQALGDPKIVGEEHAGELRRPEQAALQKVVLEQVQGELGSAVTDQEVLHWIDRGGRTDPCHGAGERFWTLDPIDGTKGFLRGEQYVVALALLEHGRVTLGVLGCPNLIHERDTGALFIAARDQTAQVMSLWNDDWTSRPIHVSDLSDVTAARFCESVESGHSSHDHAAQIAARLGIANQPLRMDSQAKYATVARGDAQIYLRLPTSADYRENIWDHAAGMILVEQAGGQVSDVNGNPLDFTHGRRLEANRGVIATNGTIHATVVETVGRVLSLD